MLLNVVLEKTLESPLDSKEIKPVNPKGNQLWIFTGKNWCWSWSSNTLATWYEELTLWKRSWCWERFKAKREEGNREWDVWMASPIQWTWTLLNSGRWWGTGRPAVMQSMGFQRDTTLATEQKQEQKKRGPCRYLKSPSCPTQTQLPKTVLKCGRNSTRQSRLFPSGTCKRNTKKNLWRKKKKKLHRKRGRKEEREGGREEEHEKERELISSQKNCSRFELWVGKGMGIGGGHDYPLQYSCQENPMDRGAWQTIVHGVTNCWSQLRDQTTTNLQRCCCSVAPVMSDSLRPHGLQHARLLCPSLSSRVCSNAGPLS